MIHYYEDLFFGTVYSVYFLQWIIVPLFVLVLRKFGIAISKRPFLFKKASGQRTLSVFLHKNVYYTMISIFMQ